MSDGEISAVKARLEIAEHEIAMLREKSHRHGNAIQVNINDVAVLKNLRISERLQTLEGWRQWVLGAAAAIGIIFGALGSYLTRKL